VGVWEDILLLKAGLQRLSHEDAVIPMSRFPELPVHVMAGIEPSQLLCKPRRPFDPAVMDFLAALSERLFADKDARLQPDVASFAYWCRRSNLMRIQREHQTNHNCIGRGIALHIAPSNTPVNFAFTYAFGLLSGNSNVVRVTTKEFAQIAIICRTIDWLLGHDEHDSIRMMTSIIRYEVNDAITAELSRNCHVRVIWGGDSTVKSIKALPSQPRCIDIAFADRYSVAVISADAVNTAIEADLIKLAEGFFMDVFLFDQNACSSPRSIIWIGDEKSVPIARSRFWHYVSRKVESAYRSLPIHMVDKYTQLCLDSVVFHDTVIDSSIEGAVFRLYLRNLERGVDQRAGKFGYFLETSASDLTPLLDFVNERYQTVTSYGLDRTDIVRFVIDNGITGVDRVVPVGHALDLGLTWDGLDIISAMSRVVSDQ
jgi:hypothetical protein